MQISSSEIKHGQMIPVKFTCQGEDINPELDIAGIPPEAKSLVLVVDDPDAAMGTWVHWIVFDIPVTKRIEENSIPGKQGTNTAGRRDYHGPCPPSGTHRYFFKIFALDTVLKLKEGIGIGDLEKAMQDHILEKCELMGLYKKQ
jgi:Raf kinase inhibitor-like YbhB/YbcL family protein